MRLPDHFELFDDEDRPFLVRFDYDRGEQQWFDARAGVGSPGYDPSVCITEVNFGLKWELPEVYPQIDWSRYEDQVMEKIIELEADDNAARDEAEYQYWQEQRRMEC